MRISVHVISGLTHQVPTASAKSNFIIGLSIRIELTQVGSITSTASCFSPVYFLTGFSIQYHFRINSSQLYNICDLPLWLDSFLYWLSIGIRIELTQVGSITSTASCFGTVYFFIGSALVSVLN
ncbi:MAG: hypothetical protein JKY74_16515 [Shewanella sp.]|nr:hypothetical protein [Shewanella sp.]